VKNQKIKFFSYFLLAFATILNYGYSEAQSGRSLRVKALRLNFVNSETGKSVSRLRKDITIDLSKNKFELYTIVAKPRVKGVTHVEFFTSKFTTKPFSFERSKPYSLFGDRAINNKVVLTGKKLVENNLFVRAVAYVNQKPVENVELTINFISVVSTKTPIISPSPTVSITPTPVATNTIAVGNPNSVPTIFIPVSDARKLMLEKLVAFRHKESTGATCISCHAPDAYDLAMLDFSDDNILRRARPHVPENIANDIATLINAVRNVYNITIPLSAKNFRPFQPGGEILPGKDIAEKDINFGRNLKNLYGLRLAQDMPIASLAEAIVARDQLLEVDVKRMKVGFAFNRWSEDGFHGKEHHSIGDWMPNNPVVILDDKESEVIPLHDTYIDLPTDENFWKLYATVNLTTHKVIGAEGESVEMALLKYKSNLLAQHLLRKAKLLGKQPTDALDFFDHIYFQGNANFDKGFPAPIWELGDFSRKQDNSVGDDGCKNIPNSGVRCIWPNKAIPLSFVFRDGQKNYSLKDQFKTITLPWMWIGWMMDQGLRRTSRGLNPTLKAEYFSGRISNAFMPELPIVEYGIKGSTDKTQNFMFHLLFMFARKTTVENFVIASQDPEKLKLPISLAPDWLSFFGKGEKRIEKYAYLNGTEEYRDLYNRFFANTALMYLYFFKDAVDNNKPFENKSNTIYKMIEYLDIIGPVYAGNEYKNIWNSIKSRIPPV
jgi:hypothetical protein